MISSAVPFPVASTRRGEPPRCRDQLVDDARLGHGVAGVGDDAQLGLRPGALAGPRRS